MAFSNMKPNTDNVRIAGKKTLISPAELMQAYPMDAQVSKLVASARKAVSNCLSGQDDRLVVVVGPCSIHDLEAAQDYGRKLLAEAKRHQNQLVIIMRVYFEKPRTTIGWKGFINDPDLDNSFNIDKGLRQARKLLTDLNLMGLPCGTEYLDVISPQFIADLISWGAIGARTTESQIHRELSSGISCPVGFKNGTNGSVDIAIDAISAARSPHHFLSVTKEGHCAIYETIGNKDTHVILRGSKNGINYDPASVDLVANHLADADLESRVMVDCSHGNSQKNHNKQPDVAKSICKQVAKGSRQIFGVMLESHLKAGNQSISQKPLTYGQSITDACIDWTTTVEVLSNLANAVESRRANV